MFTFADDTALFFSAESWQVVFACAQKGLNLVGEWLTHNVLTLNVTKTKYIPFAFRVDQLPPIEKLLFVHNNCTAADSCTCPSLARTKDIKYLGVVIDQTLSFKSHIDTLVTRLRKLIYIFRSLRHVADRRVIKMVYTALCQSIVDYCISSWGGTDKSHLIRAERAQRCILKVAAGLPRRYSTFELYPDWGVLTIRQSFILQTVLKKHSMLHFNPELVKGKRRKGMVCPRHLFRTATAHNFFCFLGDYLYNKLNSILHFYSVPKRVCRTLIAKYLSMLDYKATEDLLTIPK